MTCFGLCRQYRCTFLSKMNKRLIDEQFDPDFPNDHPKNLIPELCRHFYNIGWATGTGGKVL